MVKLYKIIFKALFKAFLLVLTIGLTCSFLARSRLYIGPNLFRPPRILSCRTAAREEGKRLRLIDSMTIGYE